MYLKFFLIFTLLISRFIYGQTLWNDQGHIIQPNQSEWYKAGLLPETPLGAAHLFDITNPEFDDGNNLNYDGEIIAAICSAKIESGTSIIYFPAGSYNFSSTIELTLEKDANQNVIFDGNIIFQGEGSSNTFLYFAVGSTNKCFNFEGEQIGDPIYLDNNIAKRTNTISASSFSPLVNGNWIRISEYNFQVHNDNRQSDPNDRWAHGCVGQITQIDNIDNINGTAEIRDEASKTYNDANDIRIWKVNPMKNIGIENLKIIRNESGAYDNVANNIDFRYAVNCWVKGVESYKTCTHHVNASYSSHLEISGCYFNDANDHGDGGRGYGVELVNSTSYCLIENNIFKKLRHAMTVEIGANCNVFIYNYSREQEWDETLDKGADLCLHGNYPFSNLFEHNIVHFIEADHTHGHNGPFNVFFRNVVCDLPTGWNPIVLRYAPFTSILGCIPKHDSRDGLQKYGTTSYSLEAYGKFVPPTTTYDQSNTWFTHLNFATLINDRQHARLRDYSYYYSEEPDFLDNSYRWPTIGPLGYSHDPIEWQYIPATDRYFYNPVKTYNFTPTYHPTFVTFDQKSSSNNSFGNLEFWENNWVQYIVPVTFKKTVTTIQTVKSDKNVNSGDKFHDWNSSLYENHNHIEIQDGMNSIIAHHDNIFNATINYEVKDGSSSNTIEFKDPWFDDFEDGNYGFKNRGEYAIFHSKQEPFYLTAGSENKGVFLNQSGPSQNWNPPCYEIRASNAYATTNGIYEFSHWEDEPINSIAFENENTRETKVVFLQPDASIKAVYQTQQLNQIQNFTLTIESDDRLIIPAGANIQCAEGFSIHVEGSLIVEGTEDQPVMISGNGYSSTHDPLSGGPNNPVLPVDKLFVFNGNEARAEINNANISNTYCAFSIEGDNQILKIKNTEISQTNVGILLKDFSSSQILLDSLQLYNNHVGISLPNKFANEDQEDILIIKRSIFNNNNYGVFIFPCASIDQSIVSKLHLCITNCVFYNMSNYASYLATYSGSDNFGQLYSYFYNNVFSENSDLVFMNKFGNEYYVESNANILFNSSSNNIELDNTITSDPLFVAPLNNDFHIKNGSPAIDAADYYWSEDDFYAPDIEFNVDEDPDITDPDIGIHFHPQLQGTISEDMTIGGEIQILNYLTVADGVTLDIEKNSTVFVNVNKKINVYGTLNAEGTSSEKITFTRSDPNNTSPTYWWGIYGISADNFILTHCEIEGARYGSYVKYEPASYDNVLFETCGTGLKFYYADNSDVSNSVFNNCGNAVTYSHSTTHLNNNTIENCDYGIWSIRGYGDITENSFSDNNYDGIYLTDMSGLQLTTQSESETLPVNNVIENNTRYGVYVSSNSNPNLGTYAELKNGISGGFNEFNCLDGDYDIYSLNESIIKAEVNYWPEGFYNNYGFVDIHPTVYEFTETFLPKITGLGKITSVDSLEEIISMADSLVANGNYRAAIGLYRNVINAEPDHKIAIKALIRIVSCFKDTNELNDLLIELDDIYNDLQTNNVGTAALDNSVTIYSLLGDYTEALSRIETVLNVYLANPDMIEETAAALYQQAMIYETMALLNPGLGKDALLASKNSNLQKIIEKYPDTDIAKYLILFEGYEDLFVQTDIIPEKFELSPAYPNPFNSTVNFQFGLKEDADVDLKIFDILGRKVWELKTSNKMDAGYHTVRWHGKNDVGKSVASGLYLVKFKANNFTASQKVILVK